ncbi:MAG: DUF6677 family protein [Fuerstiella sp.]
MRDPRINFRSRELAGLLAFLIPGAGHFYQGRRLKAGIYFTCILSLFFGGMILGDWQPVYSQMAQATRHGSIQMQPREDAPKTSYSIGYGAQVLVGLPALPSLVQQYRFAGDDGVVGTLHDPIDSTFDGVFQSGEKSIPVAGQLQLNADGPRDVVGTFRGAAQDGTPVDVEIRGLLELGRKVFGSPRREISVSRLPGARVKGSDVYRLQGAVSRPFLDWYQAPRDNAELDRLHGKLSQHFDIACVFTWIAGLLNLMAIWDAYEGPAYGYGDEEPDDDDNK